MHTDKPSRRDIAIWWIRRDLRLLDNRALVRAARHRHLLPLFIWAPDEEAPWAPGAASRWWLHRSLLELRRDLEQHGSGLIIRHGPSLQVLLAVIEESRALAVYWNRLYEPESQARDKRIERELRSRGLLVETFEGALLHEPGSIMTVAGAPYRVFTPFFRACRSLGETSSPVGAPPRLPPLPEPRPASDTIESLNLLPRIPWYRYMETCWTPGERGALERLRRFLSRVSRYGTERDRPDLESTSRLSPHLHWGEITPGRIIAELRRHASGAATAAYVRQLYWREFAHHLLAHFPYTAIHPLRAEFVDFPWQTDDAALRRWQQGRTGYPIVDAGMRELWATGWMHNRVRMIVGSFLVKDLLIPWQEGARWFWDTLVDADLANNTLGWQWVAGCGADAAPYFRIFNPTLQAAKFDPDATYVRRWVPELRNVPPERIHRLPELGPGERARLGLTEESPYPSPIVDHDAARDRALEAYSRIQQRGPIDSDGVSFCAVQLGNRGSDDRSGQ